MISHIVSAFSGKPVFGQDGPCNKFFSIYYTATYYMQERNTIYYGTMIFIYKHITMLCIIVIIYSKISDPQVTNALSHVTSENISMLVGTSETVRMFSNNLTSREKAEQKILQ